MTSAAVTRVLSSIGLLVLLCTVPPVVSAQAPSDPRETKISPVAMSANVPGLELTQATINRLATQSELNARQLDSLGLAPGKLDEAAIRRVFQVADDYQSRRFVDYVDGTFSKPAERADARNWVSVSTLEPFIQDAVNLGGFDAHRENQLRDALKMAAVAGDEGPPIAARSTAYRLLSEARQTALKTARGYRAVVDLLKRELEGRELVPNIRLILEVRTNAKQPTLAPISLVTMECGTKPMPTLVFSQRKRECSEQGVCRIESFADIKRPEYKTVFEALQKDGRAYLDGCMLNTKMLVDGTEISRTLPGTFTSHIAP